MAGTPWDGQASDWVKSELNGNRLTKCSKRRVGTLHLPWLYPALTYPDLDRDASTGPMKKHLM